MVTKFQRTYHSTTVGRAMQKINEFYFKLQFKAKLV